jgi:hypothetical protein
MNKLRTTGLLIDKKTKHKRRVLTEKLDDTEGRLEHAPRKSLKRLAQETGVSMSSARRATQLHPVKGVLLNARIIVPVLSNETINCEKYLRVETTAFSTPPVTCELQLLNSKRYRPSGMLIHRQNSHAPRSLILKRRAVNSSSY